VPTAAPTVAPTSPPTPRPTASPTPDGSNQPRIQLGAEQLDFGAGPIGGKPVPKRFSIKNLTDTPLVLKYEVRGAQAKEFRPIASDCDSALQGRMSLPVGGCYIGFGFVPADVGRRGAEVLVVDEREVYRVALSGTGVAPEPQADERAALKLGAKCTRTSATTYEVEVFGAARGPADAMLAVEIQMRMSKAPPKLISQDHTCGAWNSVSEGRSICARGNVPTAWANWRYRSSFVTKDVPATAIAFVWSDNQKQRERAEVPLNCAGKP